MRVFHVLTHFMPTQVAGTEMYVYALQSQLQALGMEGGVIIPSFSAEGNRQYQYESLKVYVYAQPAACSDEEVKGFKAPSGINSFRSLLEEIKPDVLHFHELSGSNGITVFHLAVAKSLGIPTLFTMHLTGYVCVTGTLLQNTKQHCSGVIDTYDCMRCSFRHQHLSPVAASAASILSSLWGITGIEMYKRKGKIAGLLGRSEMLLRHRDRLHQIASHCNKVVALNSWFADMLLRNGVLAEKITVVEQGLPFFPERAGSESSLNDPTRQPVRLVFVGRIYPAKGLHILLEALAACNPEDFSLAIYGPCNDAAYLRRCEALVKPGYSISFRGVIQPGETVRQLRDYDLLCLPSSVTEMAPLVIQEAFAAGIPVIASNVYGNETFIKHGENGLLFECNNIISLQQQLQACFNEPSLLLKLQKQISLPRNFFAVARDYLKLYQKLMINA